MGACGRIGVAGYSGAGKSRCSALLVQAGYELIDADREAKGLMESNLSIRAQLGAAFGTQVVGATGIDFSALGALVFSDGAALATLNQIVHPALIEQLHRRVVGCAQGCVVDAALIPLWSIEGWFDRCVWVEAPQALRLQRLLARSPAAGREGLMQRLRTQEQLFSMPQGGCWCRVDNSSTIEQLRVQLVALGLVDDFIDKECTL
jgi:dephospho-CoA kinase